MLRGEYGGDVVSRVWYAKIGIKFDVSNVDEDDNMRCACGSDEKAEFVEEAKGCLILLTPCAVQRGGSRYTADKSKPNINHGGPDELELVQLHRDPFL